MLALALAPAAGCRQSVPITEAGAAFDAAVPETSEAGRLEASFDIIPAIWEDAGYRLPLREGRFDSSLRRCSSAEFVGDMMEDHYVFTECPAGLLWRDRTSAALGVADGSWLISSDISAFGDHRIQATCDDATHLIVGLTDLSVNRAAVGSVTLADRTLARLWRTPDADPNAPFDSRFLIPQIVSGEGFVAWTLGVGHLAFQVWVMGRNGENPHMIYPYGNSLVTSGRRMAFQRNLGAAVYDSTTDTITEIYDGSYPWIEGDWVAYQNGHFLDPPRTEVVARNLRTGERIQITHDPPGVSIKERDVTISRGTVVWTDHSPNGATDGRWDVYDPTRIMAFDMATRQTRVLYTGRTTYAEAVGDSVYFSCNGGDGFFDTYRIPLFGGADAGR